MTNEPSTVRFSSRVLGVRATWNVGRSQATVTVTVGFIDLSTHEQFAAALDSALASPPAVRTVDLAEVEFMDLRAVAVPIGIRNELRGTATVLRIGPCSHQAARLFQVAQLEQVFTFEPPLTPGA